MIELAATKIDKSEEEDIRLLKVQILVMLQRHEQTREELAKLREEYPKGEAVFESIRFEYELGNYK